MSKSKGNRRGYLRNRQNMEKFEQRESEKFEHRESKRRTWRSLIKRETEGYRTGRTWRGLSKRNRREVQDRQNMEKFEQKESKKAYRTGRTWRSLAESIEEGYRIGRTWRSLSKENLRGVQDRQMEKFEQRESQRDT